MVALVALLPTFPSVLAVTTDVDVPAGAHLGLVRVPGASKRLAVDVDRIAELGGRAEGARQTGDPCETNRGCSWPASGGVHHGCRPALRPRRVKARGPLLDVPADAMPERSDVAVDNPVPTPPFWGDRLVKGIRLAEYAPFPPVVPRGPFVLFPPCPPRTV